MTALANNPYQSRIDAEETIAPRLDPVVYAASSAKLPADEERVRSYEHNGFVVLDDVFSEREVEYFQREAERLRCDRMLAKREETIVEPESSEIRSIFNVPQFSPIFQRLVHDTRLVGWARYLLNDDVYLHQSRLNFKPGFAGKEFYWHSDFETWHVEDGMPRMRAVSMSIALTDNKPSNGSVMLIPGSHRHYVSCGGVTPENHYRQSLRRQEYGVPSRAGLEQLAEGNEIAVVTGRAGSVLLFDCNTMHGSAGNITPYPRTNLFFVFNAMSNRLAAPASGQKPRPEFIARRRNIQSIEPIGYQADDYRQ